MLRKKIKKMVCFSALKGKEDIMSAHYKESRVHPLLSEPERELGFLSPQPLPLPSPLNESFKRSSVSASSSLPLPPLTRGLRSFSSEEISAAIDSQKLGVTATPLQCSTQGEFLDHVNIIGELKHPLLCKLIGFHAREAPEQRMLVYERLFHGSLDGVLSGRSNAPLIDWNARMKIALSSASVLAFLHKEAPFQAMHSELSSANIQVHKDFSAKLSGYGCVGLTLEKKVVKQQSNIWSFGVILVELLTGRSSSSDLRCDKEGRSIIQWSKPFLTDESRLSLIMDHRLQGRFPLKAATMVAGVALRCLHRDPSRRPEIATVVDSLRIAHGIRYSCLCPLQDPAAVAGPSDLKINQLD
ncbi:putative receptor-like protein kinase [Apostasia shenzhenica]|uniref:Putative receptor-like protein kinase n=1 Tax=Apostasia shenzhenica TaxID=1088818 RepID=A0A2I0BHA0_9ASPA|nr:putative receptor-like protein kinase [Apostasia shenzhenica]